MEVPASQKRWRHVQRLFADMVGLDPDRRAARLDRVGRDDPRLREEVEALLERHDRGDPLTGSPARIATGDSLILGETVGHYCLLEELGRGAMGIVYRAQDTRLKRPVALKFLSPRLSADKRARARLEREAQAASALDHPNICTVYEIGETDDGRLYLALACYDGETLEQWIERAPLEVDEAIRIAVHVARGLAAAHRHGIVHRDIKPSNILVTDSGEVKILDFGIARVADSDLTGTGDTLGTAAYMSPEHLRGQPDARSDVWALGVVLYEMLTGRRPFVADYVAALTFAVLHEDPTPLARADVPGALAEIVGRCLEKAPDLRYQKAEDVEVDLERLRLNSTAPQSTLRVSPKARRVMVSGGGLVLLLVLLFTPVRTAVVEAFGAGGLPDVQHLAILPLLSPAAEASVGEGLTLTLTSLLTSLGSHAAQPVTVVPASEVHDVTTAAAARERYGVDVVITGDFRQDGDEVQLTINLVDARTLRQFHTETLSESANRLPVLEQRAFVAIADRLGLPLTEERRDMLAAGGTANAEAYKFYLRGEAEKETSFQHMLDTNSFDEGNTDTAIELFKWAIDEDPLYAKAYSALSGGYSQKFKISRDPVWADSAMWAAREAIRIDNRLPEARTTLASIHLGRGQNEEAVREAKLAVAIDPSEVEAYSVLFWGLSILKRKEEVENTLLEAIRLNPRVATLHRDLGMFYSREKRYEDALTQFQYAVSVEPESIEYRTFMASSYESLGRTDDFIKALENIVSIETSVYTLYNVASAYAEGGRYSEAINSYKDILKIDSTEDDVWYSLYHIHKEVGGPRAEIVDALENAERFVADKLNENPGNVVLLLARAEYLALLGKETEALSMLQTVIAIRESDTDRIALYYSNGKPRFAPSSYTDFKAGVIYEILGERQKALEMLRRIVEEPYYREKIDEDDELEELRRDPRFLEMIN